MPLIFPGATRSKVVLIEGNMFQRLALVDILTLCQYNCVAFETTQKAEAYLISVSASLPPSNSRRRLQKHSQHFPLDNPSAASTGTSKPPSQYGTPEPPHTSHCDASPLSVRSEHRETGSLNPPSNSRDETAGLLESLSTDNDGHARPSGEARTHTGLLPLSSCPIHRSMPGDAGGTVHTADQGNPFVTGSTAFNPESGVSILTQEGDPSGVHRLSLAPRGAHPREYFGPPQASVKRDLLSPVATSFAVAENNCHRSSDDGRHGEPRREGAQTVDASSAYDVSRCPDYAKNSSVSPFSPFSANAQTANHMDGLQDSMMNLSAHDFGMQQATAGLRGWKAKAMLQDTTSEPPNEGLCMDAGHRRRSRLGCQVLCLDSIMGRSKENACTCREPASAEGRRAGEVTKQNRKGQETAPQVEGISNRDTSRTGENDSDLALPGEKREEAEQEDGLKIRSEETVELLLCDRNAPGMPLTLPVIKTLFTFFNVSKRSSRKSKKKSSSDVGRTPTLSGLPSTSRADFSGDVDIRGCNENSFQSNQSSPASHTVISYSHENGRLSSARCSCSEATAQRKPGDDDDDAAYRGEIERDVHSEEEGNDGYWETKPVEQEREEKEQWDCASHERVSDSRHRRRDVVCSSRLRGACLDPVSLTTSDTAASSPLSTSASSPYSPPPRNLGVREPDWKRRDCREGSLPHSDQSAFLWTAGRLSSSSSSSSSLPPSVCISTHKHRACLLTDAGGLCVAKRGREKHEAEDARRRNEHHPIERDAGESVCCRGEKEHPKWLHGCYASSAPGYEQNARRKTIPRIEEGLSSRPEDAQYREEPLASSGRQAGCCEPEKSPSVVISLSALRLSARSLQFVYPRHEEDDSESNFEYEGSSPQDISSLSESYASRCDRRVLPPAHLLRSLDLRCAPPLGFGGERGEGERQRHQMGAPCMDRDTAERGPKGPLVRWKRAEGGAKKHGGDGRYSGEWHDRESVAAEKPSVNLREGMACRQVLPCSIPDRILNLYCDTIAGREANVKDFRSQSSATSPSSCGVRTHQPSVSSSFEIKNGFCAALFQELEPRRERERILDASLAPRLRSPRARLLPSAAGAPHAESETPASRISLLYTRQKRVEETWHSSISSLLHGMDRTPRVRILSQHRLSGGESSFGRSDNSVTDSVREAPSWEPREDEKTARRVVSAALLAKQALLPQPVRSRTDTANVSRQRELEVVRAAGAVASPSPVLPQSVHLQGEARKPLEAMGPSSRTPEQHAEESGSDGESRDERQRVQPRGPTTDEDGLHTGRELGEHRVGTDTDERTRRSLDSEEESDDESDGEDASLSEEEGKGFCVYERVSMIDRGATSNVHLVKRLPDMKAFAHKEILLECMTPAEQDLAKNEVRVLKAVKDPPMIAYVDSWIEPGHTLNIIIEYAPGGSLQTYLERAKLGGTPVPTPLVRKWTAQISVGLLVLHDLRILHRDLKPSNIMLTEDLDVRLCDFVRFSGISRSLTSAEEMAETAVGTPFIMSPELCQGKPYNASSDAWALGVILFEMLELRRPFGGDSLHSLFWAIQTEGLSFRSSFEEHEDNSAQRWPSEGGELAKCLGAACETLKGREAHPLPTGVTEQARGGLLARRPVRPVPVLDPEVESERKREREDEGAKREDECRTEPGREGRKRGWDGQLMDEAWQQEQVTRAVNVNARDGRRKTETDAGRGGTNEEEPLDDREALKKLCRRLLKKDPAERPSALDMCTSSVLYADVCAFLRNHRRSDAGHFLRLLEAHRARERSTASPSPLRSDASRPCSLAFSEVSPASTGGRLRALPHRASPARPLTDTVSPASAERRVEKDESRMVASASGGAQKAREESLQMAGRGMSGGGARSDEETGGECAHCEREGRQVEHSRVKGGDGKRGNASTSVMEFYPHLTPSAKRPKYFAGGNTVNTRRGPGELYVVDEGEEEEDEEDKGDEHEENVEEAGDETRARTVRREVGIEEEEEGSETGQRDRERLRGAAVGEAEAGKNPPPVLSEEGRKESSGDTLCEGHTGTLERVYAQPAGLDPSRHSGAIAGGLSSSLALLPCLPLAAKDGDTGREDDAAVCVHPKFSDAKQEPLRDYGERDAGVEIQHGTSSRPLLPFASSSPCLLSSSSSLSSSSASLSSSSLEGASLLFHQRAAPGAHRAGGPSPSSALSSTLDSSPRSPSRSMHACFSHASKPCPLRRGIRCARSQPGRTDMQTGEELPLDPGTDWVPSRDNAKQEEGRFAELRGGGEGTREPGEGPAGSVCLQGPSVTALAYLPVGRTCSSDLAPAGEGQDVDSRRRRKEDRSDRRGNDRGEAVAREHRSFSAGINDSEKRELEVGRKPNAAEELVGGDSAENTERGGRVPDVLERRSERENEPSAAPGNGTRSNVTNFPSDDKPTPKTDSRDLLLSPPVGPSPSSRWMVPLCSHRSCSRLRLTALASPPGSSSCNDAPRLSHASSGSSILPGRASAAHTLSNYIESPEPPLVPSSLCPASPASVSSAACLSPAAAVSSLSSPVHFSQGSTPDPCLTSPASPVASLSTQSSPGLPLKKLVPSLGLTRSAGGFPAPLRGFGEGRLKAETAGSLLRARGQPHLAGSPPSPSQRRSSGASWVARKPRRETRLCCVKSSTSRAAIAHAIRRITRLRRPSRRQRKETLERLEAERGGESHPEGGPQKANGSERRRDKGLDCRRRTGKCSSGERDPGDPEEAVVRRQEEERLDQLDRQGAEQRWRGAGSDPEGDCRSGVREKAARASLCWMRKCADRRPTGGMALAPGNKGPAGCFHSLSASCSSFASPGRATARPFARDSFSVPPRASSALCLLARFASSAAFSASSSALARPRLLASAFPGRPSEATERAETLPDLKRENWKDRRSGRADAEAVEGSNANGATGDREARGESRLVSLPVANHRGIGDASGDGAHAKLDTMRGEGREQNGDSDGEDTSVEEGSSFRFEWFCTFLLFLWCARAWLTGSDGGCGEKRKHLTGDWGDAEAEKDPDDRGSRAAGRQVEANVRIRFFRRQQWI
ncbi:putative NEK kinase [Neospora caninum Liverpool]|uniref:non-specific serine/threonine protein kinase n=1 Tax=Neospora caninum (strain Liverpool) TaxID=572307 RepID=F0VBN4_NEOCL|nr:putative NEK kinase [Neospora caninum Liverpool]CBZ51018.1 putative NEK kinase [Neospora caninum Liverpool]|eukprot:XP_003881051.1 putative NEK kinase [Neospora caninum Liverpool]